MEKSKAFQTSKVKRSQYHQTNVTTDAKGTSLGRKHKRRKRPTENKNKTIKEKVIESYRSVITLNVNGLHAPVKTLVGHVCTSTYHVTPLEPPKFYVIIL